MSQIDSHLKWCLKDPRRLKKVLPDLELAQSHLKKSEHNREVMQDLEKLKHYDWALNAGYYAIYHCFLAILAKFGYETRNQSCSLTALLSLIEEGKLSLDRDLVLQFDTLEVDPQATDATAREKREVATYGVGTSIDTRALDRVRELMKDVQRATIGILAERS